MIGRCFSLVFMILLSINSFSQRDNTICLQTKKTYEVKSMEDFRSRVADSIITVQPEVVYYYYDAHDAFVSFQGNMKHLSVRDQKTCNILEEHILMDTLEHQYLFIQKAYYPNELKKYERPYTSIYSGRTAPYFDLDVIGHQADGIYTDFYKNGQLRVRFAQKDRKLHGPLVLFDESGEQLVKAEAYKGFPSGKWTWKAGDKTGTLDAETKSGNVLIYGRHFLVPEKYKKSSFIPVTLSIDQEGEWYMHFDDDRISLNNPAVQLLGMIQDHPSRAFYWKH